MTIEKKYIDLINADIDGEIAAEDKGELDVFLAENEDARSLQAELATLCGSIDSIDPESPPPHLRHVIANSVKPTPVKAESPGILQMLSASPVLKYSGIFASGGLLTLSLLSSDRISNEAFDDVTGLVGTISDPISRNLVNSIAIDNTNVAGQVSLRSSGSMLILDFGSQYTQLIARRVRELNVYCEIYPYNKIPELTANIKGVIVSGSPFSVRDKNAPIPDLSKIRGSFPLLGVCYGAQYLAWVLVKNPVQYGRRCRRLLELDCLLHIDIKFLPIYGQRI